MLDKECISKMWCICILLTYHWVVRRIFLFPLLLMFYFKTKLYFPNIQCPMVTNSIIVHVILIMKNNQLIEEARSMDIQRAVNHDTWLGLSWSELAKGITSWGKWSPHSLDDLIHCGKCHCLHCPVCAVSPLHCKLAVQS